MIEGKGGRMVSGPSLRTAPKRNQLPKSKRALGPPAGRLVYGRSARERKRSRKTRAVKAMLGWLPLFRSLKYFQGSRPVTWDEIAKVPWQAICHLDILYRNGQTAVGTGFLVGPRTVLTAGHCVYASGQPATSVIVVPAREGNYELFGVQEATMVDFPHKWRDAPEYEHDYGAVFLQTPTEVGHTLSYAVFADTDVAASGGVNVAGYPKHGDGSVIMETDFGPLVIDVDHPVNQRILYHALETYEGQSGGPIMHYDKATKALTVIGIHTYGDHDANIARRIDQDLASIIGRWVAAPHPFMAGAQIS